MKDKDIRLVALDLDGTTLNDYGEISERTMEAFRRAMEQGIHIVICTGRTFQSLPEQLFHIEGLEYVVTSNGAKITRLADRETVYENNVGAKAVMEIAEILRPTGYSLEVFVNGGAYIAKEEYEEYQTIGSTFRDIGYVLSTRKPVPEFFDFIRTHRDGIENINISFPHMEDREILMKMLAPVENVTLTSSFIHNIEVGGATTSKAEALRYLMRELHLSSGQLMAVGDSLNDLEMIRLAEIGVVMANASDEMKRYGDYVTDTNGEDGVAKAMERFAIK
ncbi:MAG: HAD family phosphatase [Firmicutes bacterium]|nr:HAD family phosphatase [Bacillota bacterium]